MAVVVALPAATRGLSTVVVWAAVVATVTPPLATAPHPAAAPAGLGRNAPTRPAVRAAASAWDRPGRAPTPWRRAGLCGL